VIEYPVAESWQADGVNFYTACTYCVENSVDYSLLVWNPATGDVAPSGLTLNGLGDALPLTGEQLTPQQSALYPTGERIEVPHSDGLPGSYNVIVLTASARPKAAPSSTSTRTTSSFQRRAGSPTATASWLSPFPGRARPC